MLCVSFTPDGDWFIFNTDGKTIARGFKTRRGAEAAAREIMSKGDNNAS